MAERSIAVGSVPRDRALAFLVGLVAALGYFLTAPPGDQFWSSDAPRHALNGVFLHDLVAAIPWRDPTGFALQYYTQYPALSIIFYPPLFYIAEAVAFAVGGVHGASALATEAVFAGLLAVAGFGIGRRVFGPLAGVGFALLVVGAPETLYWGRQVMLDVPCTAMIMLAVWAFVGYLLGGRPMLLYAAAAAGVAAIYIKYNAVFVLPAFFVVLLAVRGRAVLRDRHFWIACIAAAAVLLPGLVIAIQFAEVNAASVGGRDMDLPRWSIANWLYYLTCLPGQVGWVTTLLAAPGAWFAVLRPRNQAERITGITALAWFAAGYVIFSLIGHKEPRVSVVFLPPMAFFAVFAVHRLLPARLGAVGIAGLGAATLAASLLLWPTPVIKGYAAVADYVAANAPPDAVVVFFGYRDGNFIFAMRTHGERPDIYTVRADKVLVNVSVMREFGVTENALSEANIADLLKGLGTDMVVAQIGFWQDLAVMKRFEAMLASAAYARVIDFEITGDLRRPQDGATIAIYRPTGPVVHPPRRIDGITAMGKKIMR